MHQYESLMQDVPFHLDIESWQGDLERKLFGILIKMISFSLTQSSHFVQMFEISRVQKDNRTKQETNHFDLFSLLRSHIHNKQQAHTQLRTRFMYR